MNLNIQFQIKSNPNYQRYLRENSYWYKILNRNPENFNAFAEEMKKRYRLTTTDKINNVLEKFQLIQKFMSIMR
jgi:hypothetical protein